MSTPETLRHLADKIEGFPKYIRRDNGSASVRSQLAAILKNHYGEVKPDAVADLDSFTRKLRDTVEAYYRSMYL